jgi:hypothetical protein
MPIFSFHQVHFEDHELRFQPPPDPHWKRLDSSAANREVPSDILEPS